jgi:UDP-N-acetylmuramyl pentapeptide phosphotransferase/UDP-N-acetylglucosamine-1-phosphate transferase
MDGAPMAWLALCVVAFAISAAVTACAIRYAKRRQLIDHPGARRSHTQPTPRGGGIGIVVAVLVCACLPGLVIGGADARIAALSMGVAIAIVAAVGWIDDHRGLPARTRFVAHTIAAIVFVAPAAWTLVAFSIEVGQATSATMLVAWIAMAVLVVAIVWSINLHNFMDGIDGILAMQATFVFVALAVLIVVRGHDARAVTLATFAAATLGFLPFNFPRARVFMGDVGSGVLGLLIAIGLTWQFSVRETAPWSGLVLASAFVIDATATLVSRMVRGRRWYHAHREHLYQWLARCGFSHAGVVAFYMGWNLAVAAPVVAWINRTAPTTMTNEPSTDTGADIAVAVYLVGFAVWIIAKRRCLASAKARRRHAAA